MTVHLKAHRYLISTLPTFKIDALDIEDRPLQCHNKITKTLAEITVLNLFFKE